MRSRDVQLIADLLTTAIERTADAIGRAVATALTPPAPPELRPGVEPEDDGGPVLSDEQIRAAQEFLADPTDGVGWLAPERPSAMMGPAGRNPWTGGG